MGWFVAVTDKGGAFSPELLSQFDAVIWNNDSGDFVYFWNWYADELLGARFTGHPMERQFQDACVDIEESVSGIGTMLAPGWTMIDESYSFATSPRGSGADVVATLDETTYSLKEFGGQDLAMGEDHLIVWTRCVGKGRAAHSAIGHCLTQSPTYVEFGDKTMRNESTCGGRAT